MKRSAAILLSLFFASCNSPKIVTGYYDAGLSPSPVTITLLIETSPAGANINDVVVACHYVKAFKIFIVNYVGTDRIELKLLSDYITTSQKEELLNRIYLLGASVTELPEQ